MKGLKFKKKRILVLRNNQSKQKLKILITQLVQFPSVFLIREHYHWMLWIFCQLSKHCFVCITACKLGWTPYSSHCYLFEKSVKYTWNETSVMYDILTKQLNKVVIASMYRLSVIWQFKVEGLLPKTQLIWQFRFCGSLSRIQERGLCNAFIT